MKSVGISAIILYNDKQEVLMQHRDDNKKFLPGYWGSFGGHIEEGETPEEALKRELIEELEYEVKNPTLFVTSEFTDEDKRITTYNFIEKYDEAQPLVLHEGQGYGWFSIPEALKLKVTELRKEALLKTQDFLNSN